MLHAKKAVRDVRLFRAKRCPTMLASTHMVAAQARPDSRNRRTPSLRLLMRWRDEPFPRSPAPHGSAHVGSCCDLVDLTSVWARDPQGDALFTGNLSLSLAISWPEAPERVCG